jgi:hypothetical protein
MATTDARAARERKQKIFVAVGGLFLLALLAIQLPKLMGGSEPTTAAATTGAETTTADGTAVAPTDSSAVPVSIRLVDTDRALRPGPGQLRTFGMFDRKDPFVQQVATSSNGETSSGGGGTGAGSPAGGGQKPANTPSKSFTVGGSSGASVTVIAVNGVRQTLAAGTAFPAADPVFVLVAEQPGAKTAVIGVAGGAYASGARTTKLKVGKPLVLVNTTTGARYRLVLVAVGNGAAAASENEPASNGTGAAKP